MSKPDCYSHGHDESVLRSHRWRTVENSAAYLRPHLRPGMRLLDVGCGPATLTLDLARHIPNGTVIAIDRAESVLDEARATVSGSDVQVRAGDVYALDFEDRSFDVVHAHQVLQHLTEPVRALKEMRRVCKPGGIVAVRDGDYGSVRMFPEDRRFDTWMKICIDVMHSNQAFPDAGLRLLGWAQEAGFGEVNIGGSVWVFATPDTREWWAGMWAERIVNSTIAEQALQRGFATRAELEDIAQAFREWNAAPSGWFSMVHGEVIARP